MKVEIGALVEKEYGELVKDEISQVKGVEYVFFATGRSNDLFDQKQFGNFGEASIITIIAEEACKDDVFDQLFMLCELNAKKSGVVYMSNPIVRSTIINLFRLSFKNIIQKVVLEWTIFYEKNCCKEKRDNF